MLYSVYNTSARSYEYYETPELAGATHAGAPAKSILASSIGATVEQAAWTLPIAAKRIGSGTLPRGRIATKGSMVPFADVMDAITPTVAIGIGIAAYFLWRNR